jgi:hypothetical protein
MKTLELDDILRERLGAEIFAQFTEIRSLHFWLWKTHRVCDDNSLRGLRFYLYHAGVLALAPQNRLVRRRPFHDYAATLGIHLDQRQLDRPFAGDRFPGVDLPRDVSEPGDGVAVYEEARLGWTTHGYGAALNYSLEATLLNCLREPIRWAQHGSCKSYLYPEFDATLKELEVWSTVDAVDQLLMPDNQRDGPDPAEALLSALTGDGGMPASSLPMARGRSQERFGRSGARNADGELSVFIVMLGFLIDELLARLAAPNGMGFGYLATAAQLQALLKEFDGIFLPSRITREGADELRERLEGFLNDCKTFATGPAKQAADGNWTMRCRQTADRLRDFGFQGGASRTLDAMQAELVFLTSNVLWRWTFFLDQREAIANLHPSLSTSIRSTASDMLWSWLQRPWGIVTPPDIVRAFRGLAPGDEHDEVPRAFAALFPMLKTSVVAYLETRFGFSADHAQRAVRQLINSRYNLYLVRRLARDVLVEPGQANVEFVEAAGTLIACFSRWLFHGKNDALGTLEGDLTELPAMLRLGDWLRDHLSGRSPENSLFSRAEVKKLAPYLSDPSRFLAEAFRFEEPKFDLVEQAGLLPLEHFRFVSTPPIDAPTHRCR